VRDLTDAPQLVARKRKSLNIDAYVGDLQSAVLKRSGRRDRGLDRAASAQRTTTVVDPGEKALLESVGDVSLAGEGCATTGATQQLKRGLAVAVFEILVGEPMAMGDKQQLAARSRDERNRLDGVERGRSPRSVQRSEAPGSVERNGTPERVEFGASAGLRSRRRTRN
jgi:hypothetical protein